MGGRQFLSVSFCLYVVALNVYLASNAWGHEGKSSSLVLQLQSAEYLEPRRAAVNEAGRSVGVVMKGPTPRDLNSV